MVQRMKKKTIRLFAIVLIVMMTASLLPLMSATAYADEGGSAVVTDTESAFKATANTDQAQTIWYAGHPWRVISFNEAGNEFSTLEGVMTLLSTDILGQSPFHADAGVGTANYYSTADLKTAVDGIFTSLFSEKEQEAVAERVLEQDEWNERASTGISGAATTAYLWPLSTAEAYDLPSDNFRSATRFWWLRSPGMDHNYAATVSPDGTRIFDASGLISNCDRIYGIRPAFYLNLFATLFTSAAEGGKSAVAQEGVLPEVTANAGNEWKMTLKDDGSMLGLNGHKGFKIDNEKATYDINTGVVTIPYSGAITGENEYISAIVKDSNGVITRYGKLTSATSASGTVSVKIKGILGAQDTLYVFNEQDNGDKATDYASALLEVNQIWVTKAQVTFQVKGGFWNDGTREDKTVTLASFDGEENLLAETDIPAVGEKPATYHYPSGSWDVTPNTETAITGDTTFIFTYDKNDNRTILFRPGSDGSGVMPTQTVQSGSTYSLPLCRFISKFNEPFHMWMVWNFDTGEMKTYRPGQLLTVTNDLMITPMFSPQGDLESTQPSQDPGTTNNNNSNNNSKSSGKSPKTGDENNLVLWLSLMSVSLAGIIGLTIAVRKKRD